MKRNKLKIDERIKEIHSYLLYHNMADMSIADFWKLTNELHVIGFISEKSNLKSYRTGNYMDSYRLIK